MKEYILDTLDTDDLKIQEIVAALKREEIGIFPTDTIYGIVGLAKSNKVKQKIYAIKNRDSSKQLILQIGTNYNIKKIVKEVNNTAKKIINKFLPGQVTLIFHATDAFKTEFGWSMETVAIRIPDHALFLQILNKINEPLFVTSANISDENITNNITELKAIFKDKVDFIVNDQKNYSTIPSTIIDVTSNKLKIIREGIIKSEVIADFILS